MKAYFNGEFVDTGSVEELLEPGFLFGWGAFETLRVYQKKIVFLSEHLRRFKDGLGFLGLEYPDINFRAAIDSLLLENNLSDAYLRITVFKKRKSIGLLIYVSEFNYYKEDAFQQGAGLVFAPFIRYSQDPFLKVKSISYVKSRTAWAFARKQGKDEAIFLNEKGAIQEGSRSNIFFVRDSVVCTPSLECGILDGVTRAAVIDICRKSGIKVIQGEFNKEDLLSAQEVFLTSSLMEVMPVSEIEGRRLDNKKFTLAPRILEQYRGLVLKS